MSDFHVGDLVQIREHAYPFSGKFATVQHVDRDNSPFPLTLTLVFGPAWSFAYGPSEVKLIRRAHKPGWGPIRNRVDVNRIYKDDDGAWVTEQDLRHLPRFPSRSRHPWQPDRTYYRDHDTYAEALATFREQTALDEARRDEVTS